MLKLGHLTLGGGRSQGKRAAGQEVSPERRGFCRAQEERGVGRHEGRHPDFAREFLRFGQLE